MQLSDNIWYAMRVFWRRPGFAAASVAMLAIGIGANHGHLQRAQWRVVKAAAIRRARTTCEYRARRATRRGHQPWTCDLLDVYRKPAGGVRSCESTSDATSKVPRTFTSPSTASATPGMRVAGRRGRISRTIPAGAAQISAPMRKMTAWSVGELAISIEEKKIPKGVRASNQIFASDDMQCTAQIRRPFSLEFEGRASGGMAECQSGRVKRLTGGRALQ